MPEVGDSFLMWAHNKYPVRNESESWPFLDLRSDGRGVQASGPQSPPAMGTTLRAIGELDAAPSFDAVIETLRAEIRRDDEREH